jgi:hypothetical protein
MSAPIRTLEGMRHQLRLRGLPAEIAPSGDGRLCVHADPARGVRLRLDRCGDRWIVEATTVHPLPRHWLSDTGAIIITADGLPSVLRDCADWCLAQADKARYRRLDEDTARRLKSAARRLTVASTTKAAL